jgi:hypothetical protein
MNVRRMKRPSPAFVIAMIALFVALTGTAGAVVSAAVPLAKRALVADNAKKLGGQSAAQIIAAGAKAGAEASAQVPGPASSAAGLVTRKTSTGSVGPGTGNVFTIACDAGQKVMGGGFSSDGPLIVAVSSGPTDDATWSLGLLNLDDAAGHNVNLFATCIK